ncbi:D-alanyl-D-alanine carboxypeptidase family protein [Lachnospiraceae bacterium 62-35]
MNGKGKENRTKKKDRKKRFLSWILAAVMAIPSLIPAYAKPEWPNGPALESESGIVVDMDSGTVLFGQYIHEKKAPASITKLLTALVVIERADLDAEVIFSHDAVYNVESGSGNKMAMEEGDRLTVRDCLYLLLLQSSNQAANALAEHVAGTRDGFVELMNQKVAELGCTNTQFANPSGLNDERQYTTAYDMSLIGMAAFKNPVLLEIDSTKKYTIPATINNPDGRTFQMEHKLLITEDEASENYYPAAKAGKTGYTSIAGQTLVTYAEKDGKRLVAVTLRSRKKTHYSDTKLLLEFGFQHFHHVNISENETSWVTGEEPLLAGGETYQPSELFIDKESVITLPGEAVFADGEKRLVTELLENHPEQAVAKIEYTYNDRKIGSAWICTTRDMAAQTSGEPEDQTSGSQSNASKSPEKEKPGVFSKFHMPSAAVLVVAAVILCAVLGTGGFFWYRKKQKEEQERQRVRREKRRKRLEEIGYTEEEFANMMSRKREERV